MTSSITIGQLCIYYFRKTYAELKKERKNFTYNTTTIFTFCNFCKFNFLNLFWLYKERDFFLDYFFFYAAPCIFCSYFYSSVGYTEISYAKRVIIFSGLTMLLVNFSSSWILESKFMQNNLLKFRMPIDEEILKSSDPIYSEAYDIEDVWKLGKQIKTLNKNMPDEREIIFFRKRGT